MKLKSFGCSFIYGTDLADADMIKIRASRHTWPALLAQHLGRDYECYARPGSGNLQILEQVLNQAAVSAAEDLFVISWSWIDRFDYYAPDQTGEPWHDWSTIMPADNNDTARTYYRDLHSEYRDKLVSLSHVRLAIDTLKQKGIPFVMTYMDQLLLDQRWHVSPAVVDLQEYVKPHLMTFEGQTFLDWSRAHGYAESAGWHPLEAAHCAAFESIKNHSFS